MINTSCKVNRDEHTRAKFTMFIEFLWQVKTFRQFVTGIFPSLKKLLLVYITHGNDSVSFISRHLAPFPFIF